MFKQRKSKFAAILSVLVCCCMMLGGTALAQSDSTELDVNGDKVIDNAPVIGEYKPNPQLEAISRQKELAAHAHYAAKQKQITSGTARTDRRLSIYQYPQETDYWCGYAALESLLSYEGVSMTQAEIADYTYSQNEPCPWYINNGDDIDQFPSVTTLNSLADYPYVPYPLGNAGATPLQSSEVKTRLVSTIDDGHGVLACGESKGDLHGDSSILPGYPARRISHWLASDGYQSDGANVWIVDPAKSEAVSFSGNIQAYYSIPIDKFTAYIQPRGMIW